ncbi:substrate-binding domain-containing protein [Opitutia bacterium ISCC 51]|nr:substrate-binding domain-containing protein [Opitutae bacterium ISCC 51]QXD30196.1 substrate-binding domain-containing protein [Opitutae bacterium ISCC 52]
MTLTRQLLRNDVLAELKSNIANKNWRNTLPSERQLTDQFQVSRGTLRYALRILQEEGIIASIPGSGYLIKKRIKQEFPQTEAVSIGILIGAQEENEEARSLTWIPALQHRVAKRGWNVFIHDSIPEISRSPATGLKKLIKSTNHKCWLLIRCSKNIQSQFRNQSIPAIICGSPFRGIDLPSIDLNYEAIGRHAAGLLASKGHQRIGYVRSRTVFPGDQECLASFKSTLLNSSAKPSLKIVRHAVEAHDYRATLEQVISGNNPITALFIDSPFQYLRIFTQALEMGIKIPSDLSLISRHECDFLHHLSPKPACYEFNPRKRAVKIHQILEERIQGDTLRNHRTLLIPEFRTGKSIKRTKT